MDRAWAEARGITYVADVTKSNTQEKHMSDFVHKECGGSLFRNDYKEKANQPDHRGDCKIDGVDYWISAWINEGKNGKYFGLKFEKKEDKHQTGEGIKPIPPEDLDDDIPF